MDNLETRSPYARKRSATLKNTLRARRAHSTLIQAYCDAPGDESRWSRLNDYEKTYAKIQARWESINAAHNQWIENELRRMRLA